MAARATRVGDTGKSALEPSEPPFGTGQVHVVLSLVAVDQESLAVVLERARQARARLPGCRLSIGRTSTSWPPAAPPLATRVASAIPRSKAAARRTSPVIIPRSKAGEFVLGYPDQTGNLPPMPEPAVVGRNGTFVVWRKLHTRVAAFRRFLHDNASNPEEKALLAATIVGRWPSGAPLILAPERDNPTLGADEQRNNDFLYNDVDPHGLFCRMAPAPGEPIGVTRRSSAT
jgi:hypothetical protein